MGYKAALVTGGAHRLGRAVVETISQQGVAVAVHYSSSKTAADRKRRKPIQRAFC